jgi:membrane-associated phospholipid phosphatase
VNNPQPDHATMESAVAGRLASQARSGPVRSLAPQILMELDALDRAVYAAIAQVPTPGLDPALRRLSDAADHSKLWIGAAAALAAFGGRRGRRTALVGLATVAVTSASVNTVGKYMFRRSRPDRLAQHVPEPRHVHMPVSSSFPSGHSASAFAFVNAVSAEWPLVGLPLRALAALVAYSRIHTGVHYPGDVVVGSLIGAAVGDSIASISRRAAC